MWGQECEDDSKGYMGRRKKKKVKGLEGRGGEGLDEGVCREKSGLLNQPH